MVGRSRQAQEAIMHGTVLSEGKADVFTSITSKIVSAIEAGAREFNMPWHGGIISPSFPVNASTDKPYRGVNVVALWVDAMVKRYISGYWASYKQWQDLGAQVRKGERGSVIVFYKKLDQSGEDKQDAGSREDEGTSPRFVARASHVFNSEQVDGWELPIREAKSVVAINEEIAEFIKAIGADVRHGSHMAVYRRREDYIEMPMPELFVSSPTSSPTEAYHAVLLHELTHWTGAEHRLNREFGKRFGDKAYAFEELVAELGSAFLCSAFRITNEPRPDHAAYVSSWLNILHRDTKAVFSAASRAQEAVQFLMELATANSCQ
jgi:Antirestriction protein